MLPWHISLSRQYTGSKGIEDIKGKEGYSFPLHIRSTRFFSSRSENKKNNGLIHLLRSGGGGGGQKGSVGYFSLAFVSVDNLIAVQSRNFLKQDPNYAAG